MPTVDNWRALREALAELPNIRQWFVVGPPWGKGDFIVSGHPNPHMGQYVCDTEDFDGEGRDVLENAAYIAAANPATIRALLAERDRLAAEVEALQADAVPCQPLEEALKHAYYYTESGEWRGPEVDDWARWHSVAKVAAAMKGKP